MTDLENYGSFAHRELLISLLVPQEWQATEEAKNVVRFFGPEHPELQNYQPTFSITLSMPNGFGDEWFNDLCAKSLERLQEGYEDFELQSTEHYMNSSLAQVNALWFQWQPEPSLAFCQVQALIPLDRYRLYLINGATLAPLADTYLPIFDRMLKSLRILPHGGTR